MRVFLIAGESSGDRLGAALMEGLKSLKDVEFQGVGGPLMEAEGIDSLFPMDELSVMGLAEIIPKYPHLRRRLHETADAVLAAEPDVLVTIDSPDFCLRVAKLVKAKKKAIRTVHYVAPSVWAWRAGRATKMAKVIDQVLCLLPFEPPYMEAAGMACDFVGHPVVSEEQAKPEEIQEFKARHGLEGPVWMILPGSRRGEIERLGARFGDVVRRVLTHRPDLSLVIPTTASVAPMVREMVAEWPVNPVILDPSDHPERAKAEKRAAFGAADWALAASGTVSLELAAAGTPMVIAYDLKPLSRFIISRMLKVDTLTLVNLVSETRAVPEFIGKHCRPELIAPAMLEVMDNPQRQREAMNLTMERLGRGGEAPGLRAARAILARLDPATR